MRKTSTAVQILFQGKTSWRVVPHVFPLGWADQDRFHATGDALPIGVALADSLGDIVLVNHHLSDLSGCPRDALIGQPLETLLRGRSYAVQPGMICALIVSPLMRVIEADGESQAVKRGNSGLCAGAGFAPMTANLVEINACISASIKRRRADDDLGPPARLASQDLCDLLRGIADLLEWVADDTDCAPNREVSRYTRRAVARVERLVTDLLICTRVSHANAAAVQVHPQALIAHVLGSALPRGSLPIETDSKAARFIAAKAAIETVLGNLIFRVGMRHGPIAASVLIRGRQNEIAPDFAEFGDGAVMPLHVRFGSKRSTMLPYAGHERI